MSIEKDIEEFEHSIQSFISSMFSSSYIENTNNTNNISDSDSSDKNNFIVENKELLEQSINRNRVNYRIGDEEYNYTKKCYPTVDLQDSIEIKKDENINDKLNNSIDNYNIIGKLMDKEQKQRILTDLKNICHRLNVVSNVKPHDKLWIDEKDDDVRFEIDNTYWLKSLTQPLYRYASGQGRIRIINQIVNDTNYLGTIYPKLNDSKKNIVKKIIEREQADELPIGTIAGLENMKQMYSNYKDKINQIISKLRSIINQNNESIDLDTINQYEDVDNETDNDLVKTLEKELN